MRFLRTLALAWPARSPNSLVANLTKVRPAGLSAPARISRAPCQVSMLQAMPLVRGTTPPGPLPTELQRESRRTNQFLCVSPHVAPDLRHPREQRTADG